MANLNLSQFTEKTFVADADWVFVWDTAGLISKKVSRNSLLNSGTLATSAPVTISQTWNDAAQTFTALRVNAAGTSDANSASGSLLLDLQVNGASKAWVTKQGGYRASNGQFASGNGIGFSGASVTGFYSTAGANIFVIVGGLVPAELRTDGLNIQSGFKLGFGAAGSSSDTVLVRDDANTLALRNGGAAQTFNVYGTFTTAITNFERLAIKYNATDVAYQIAAEKGTTNGDYRPLDFVTGGSRRMTIGATGNVGIGTTAPSSKLHVVGDAVLTGDLLGTNYTIGVPTILTQSNISITNTHSGVADSAIVITPKGTGGVIFGPKPDGTLTGGNARGARAIDHQISRNAAAQVASGTDALICGGNNNTASNQLSIVVGGASNASTGYISFLGGGQLNTSSSNYSTVAGGNSNTASATWSTVSGGQSNTASSSHSFVAGGYQGLANRFAISAHAAGQFSALGDAQATKAVFRNKTTTNSAVELFLDGASARYTVTSGKIISMLINITGTKSDGSAVAHYVRQYSIKNVGGTTSQVYAPVTIGTDNAAGTSIALSADDTNDSLKIEVTGVTSETWRWVASVDAVEVGYGV